MARITQQSSIHTTGTTYENEPIIKSDGDGEVMQWIPSDGDVADGITIDEPGATNPLRLGIGTISPTASFHVKSPDFDVALFERSGTVSPAIMLKNSGGLLGGIVGVHGGGLDFRTAAGGGAATTKLIISSAGLVGIGVAPSGGRVRAAGAYVSTAQNTVHEPSVTKLSHETGDVAQLAAYGADASTAGSIRLVVKASLGGESVDALTISPAGLTTVKNPGWPLKNELTNSGFDVWSNSGDLFTTGGTVPAIADAYTHDTETCNDNAGDDESGDWSETGGGTISYAASTHYVFDGSAANEYVHSAADFTALTAGKLYELSITFADASAAQTIQMGTFTTGGGTAFTPLGADITTTGSEVAHVRCFEAVGTERRIGFKVTSNPGGSNNVHWTDSMLHEVTPGCVVADDFTCDGWAKDGAGAIGKSYRQHKDATLSKDGSFYSHKFISHASADNCLYQVPFSSVSTYADGRKEEVLQRVAGRTMTFGAWVYSASGAADDVAIFISDSERGFLTSHHDVSAFHSASTGWEWLEVTFTFGASPVAAYVGFYFDGGTTTSYVSQPMLVFGSAIGSGNYSRPMGEFIWLEKRINPLNSFGGVEVSSEAAINLEAESNGKIPKGAAGVNFNLTGTGAVGEWVNIAPSTTTYAAFDYFQTTGEHGFGHYVGCDSNGDIAIWRNGTLANVSLKVLGVKLR